MAFPPAFIDSFRHLEKVIESSREEIPSFRVRIVGSVVGKFLQFVECASQALPADCSIGLLCSCHPFSSFHLVIDRFCSLSLSVLEAFDSLPIAANSFVD